MTVLTSRSARRSVGLLAAGVALVVAGMPAASGGPLPSAVSATASTPHATVAAAAGAGFPAASWLFRGSGWGHSLGMSQYGAMEMAKDGRTAAQILGLYYSGTTYDAVTDTQTVMVNVLHRVTSVSATPVAILAGGGSFTVTLGGSQMAGTLGTPVTLTRSGSTVVASCPSCSGSTRLTGSSALLVWDSDDRTGMTLGGTTYRDGRTVITPSSGTTGTLEVVNQLRLHDEYLDHLREVPWSWPVEALKAQAAAARGYAVRAHGAGIRSACACHLYDTTSDQVYGGYPTSSELPFWASWRAAVRAAGGATTGYVVRSNGQVIQAFYASSHGGRSENNEDVWGGTPLPYLRGVSDPWSLRASNPRAFWTKTVSGSATATAFGLADIARIDLRDRTDNGGVRTAVGTSSAGVTRTITGEQLRARLALNSIAIRHLSERYDGATRYVVGAAVAASVAPSATSVVLAAGDSTLVDAAVSGPLAATLDAPLLLTTAGALPAPTVAELDRRGTAVRTAYVVGGPGVVAESVLVQLRARGLSVVRLAGANRYGTSEAVLGEIRRRRSTPTVVVAGGAGLPDALSVSGPASALREPILLTPATGLAAETLRALDAGGPTTARVVGDSSVVGDEVVTALGGRGMTVVRLGGATRYSTSRAIVDFYRPRLPTTAEVVLTSGADANLVDSLVAGTRQRLVVLTQPTVLVEDAAASLQGTPLLQTVTAIGGASAVAPAVLTAAANS
ncbi:MAG TPA: SpoIID/LytB domain-containing protein [Ornithinibacter sp.]|nr:SpoIID/LytB domain-containing protein [Ornithinibacter sp.]